jgi:hypothetical protein
MTRWMSRHYCPAPIPRAPSYQELLGAHHIGSRAHLCLAEPLNMRRSSWRRCVASYFESTKRGFIASSPRWKELAPELARDFPKPTPEEYERARQRELKDSHRGSRFPYDFLEEVAMDSKYEATQRRQLERLRFLLEGGYLDGPAIQEAALLKREYETGQRRYQWGGN